MASPSNFSHVIFHDVPQSYTRSTPITCQYTVAAGFQPFTKDWVGMFKVGWSSTKDHINHVMVDPVHLVEQEPVKKQIQFDECFLPNEETDFYQFCYVDHAGHVRGASTPFSVQPPEELMEVSMDADMIVVTTQEGIDRSIREKEELRQEVEQWKGRSHLLQTALDEKQNEVHLLQQQNKEWDRKCCELLEEVMQSRQQEEVPAPFLAEKRKEAQPQLLDEKCPQTKKQLDPPQDSTSEKSETEIRERHQQALVQIHQLKADVEQQRLLQSEEMSEMKAIRAEEKEELVRLKDRLQLLQVDLRCSERDRERLSVELSQLKLQHLDVEKLRTENRELRQSLAQQEARHRTDQDYKVRKEEAERGLLHMREQSRTKQLENDRLKQHSVQLQSRLEESQKIIAERDAAIAEITEIIELRENRLNIHNQERERLVRDHQVQLAKSQQIIAEKDAEIADFHGIAEMHKNQLEILNQEKQHLVRENQRLKVNMAELQREQNLADAMEAFTRPERPAHGAPPHGRLSNTAEKPMVCRSCHLSLPGATAGELKQHEQSHRVCPFCTLLCDHMEQAAFEDHVYSHEL